MLRSRLPDQQSGGIHLQCWISALPQSRGYELGDPKDPKVGRGLEKAFIVPSLARSRIHSQCHPGVVLGYLGEKKPAPIHLNVEGVFKKQQSDGWTELEVDLIPGEQPQMIGADFIRMKELRICINNSVQEMRYEADCKVLPGPTRLCEK